MGVVGVLPPTAYPPCPANATSSARSSPISCKRTAVAHFYLATIGYEQYVANLKKGMNPVRFYEYALSSSLMIVLIGMLIGIWDLGAIILLFTLNATMNPFGIMMELHNQHTQRTDWTAFIYGCVAGFIPWVSV